MASSFQRLVCLVLGAAAAACGGTPTAPTPQPGQSALLPSGRYLLGASANVARGTRDYRCAGPMEMWGLLGPNIGTRLVLVRDDNGWNGHAESADDGDMEVRLQRTGGSDTEASVAGTLRGTAVHFLDRFTTTERRSVRFGSVTLQGVASQSLSGAFLGSASGGVTFTDRSGTPTPCETVDVLLSPIS